MKAIERVMLEFAVVSTLALALAITANVAGRQLFGILAAPCRHLMHNMR